MPRDRIFHALAILLFLTWGTVALIVATSVRSDAPRWLAYTAVALAIAKTWVVYNHVHRPRERERAGHAARLRDRENEFARRQEVHTRTAAVLDAVPEAVIAADERGLMLLANASARDLFPALETPGRMLEEVFTQGEILSLHAGATQGRPGETQVRLSRHGSVRIAEVLARPLDPGTPAGRRESALNGGGPAARHAAVIVLRDVTELALAVQLKTDFVANASHELRTPLASIRLAAETMRDAGPVEPALVERLSSVVLNNTTRLEDLVRDLLDLSRIESPDVPPARERVALDDTLASLIQLFEEPCRARRLTIETRIDPDANELTSDPRLVDLVLKNLIDNAAKYAFEGTTIRVLASRLPSDGGPAIVRVKVADRGVGIPLQLQQRIFERFYQVDASRSGLPARRGTGLGLAIVKHALKRLGGTIRVESVWQQGTTMIVDLPAGSSPTSA